MYRRWYKISYLNYSTGITVLNTVRRVVRTDTHIRILYRKDIMSHSVNNM